MRESKHPSQSGRPAAERQFVDREEFIAPAHAALKEPQRTSPLVLVYFGGAGIGKSRLRRELVRQLARDPDVLTATLDFSVTSHRHPETALFFLRKTLCEAHQVRFPSFDLAYAMLWQKGHPEVPLGDDVKPLLEPGSLLCQLLDESGKLPLIGLIPRISSLLAGPLDPLNPRPLDPSLRSWWERRGQRELEDLPQMEPGAIVDCLPRLWAADLKDHLAQGSRESGVGSSGTGNDSRLSTPHSRRAVLFIDSYEKLWDMGDSRQEAVDTRQAADEWVRGLVTDLPEVLWVVCGRRKLRWEEVEADWGKALSQHELGTLPEKSARKFLESCDITDGQTQDAMIKGSQGVPHYLNLAADALQNAEGKLQNAKFGGGSPEELVEQFTRQLDKPEVETLKVLSAARFWYYGLFEHLVTEYQTGYPLTAYDDLSRFSFVGEGAAPETRTMHELMREALQEHQVPELRKRVHLFLHEYYAKQLEGLDVKNITEKHKAALNEAFYHGRQAKSAEELWTWLVPVSQVFGDAWEGRLLAPLYREMIQALETEIGPDHPSTAGAISGLAAELAKLAEHDEAEPLMWRSLHIREKVLGQEHPDTGDSLDGLSALLRNQGKYAEAEPLARRSLAIAEKAFGHAHSIVGRRLGELSAVLFSRGKYDEAEPLQRSAVAILERTLGSDHPAAAKEMVTLARLLYYRGNYAEGEQFSRRALANFEKALGPDAVDVATALDALAPLLFQQDKTTEAEQAFRRSLAIKEKTLGPSHPGTAVAMRNLAACLEWQGKLNDALPIAQRALTATEKKLGLEHPTVSFALTNLSNLLGAQGRYAEAESAARRALAIREKALGPDHAEVADALGGLARWLYAQNRYAEAEPLEWRALAITEKTLGTDHDRVAGHLYGLACQLLRQGKLAEGVPLARRALTIREAKLGPDHSLVAYTLDILAILLARQGEHAEAESSARRSLTIREKALGPEHLDVAESLEPLAAVLVRQSRYAEAEPLARRALAIREAALDPGHGDIACPLEILAELCEKTGRTSEAEALYRRALAISEKAFGPGYPFTAETLDGLAKVCEQTGRTAEAQELSARAQRIRAQSQPAPANPK